MAEAARRIRYNFGTTEGEISGERTHKRRSAKHLEFLPSLLEGRRSIQLSYGRNRIDSKTFAPCGYTVFDALTLCANGRRSPQIATATKYGWVVRERYIADGGA